MLSNLKLYFNLVNQFYSVLLIVPCNKAFQNINKLLISCLRTDRLVTIWKPNHHTTSEDISFGNIETERLDLI